MASVSWQLHQRLTVWHRLLAVVFVAVLPVAMVLYDLQGDDRYPRRDDKLGDLGLRMAVLTAAWCTIAALVAIRWDHVRHRRVVTVILLGALVALVVGGSIAQSSALDCACGV